MRLALLAALLPVYAQPRLASGRLESIAAGSNLAQQVRGFAGPAWVGYAIDAVPGQRGCCTTINNGVCSAGCALEGGTIAGASCGAEGTVFLEGERSAHVLFRIDKGEVERVRVFSPSCQLDVSGLSLHWLTGVRGADSVAFLKSLGLTVSKRGVVGAIAAHADGSAEVFLRETAESATADRADRQRAASALAASRGANGLAVVTRLLAAAETDEKFRESLPGALAQAPSGTGTSALIDTATRDRSRKVRERAFFWLGHSTDPRAHKFVEEVLAK